MAQHLHLVLPKVQGPREFFDCPSYHVNYVGRVKVYLYQMITKTTISFIFDNCSTINRFVCVEVLRPSQPNGVMSSKVSLPNHTFTGQA